MSKSKSAFIQGSGGSVWLNVALRRLVLASGFDLLQKLAQLACDMRP
jgi:hypothetical protein